MRRVGLALPFLLLLVGACVTPPPPPPIPTPTQGATAAPTPHAAVIVIDASGEVDMICPQGMRASVVILPAIAGESPGPVWEIHQDDQIELDLEPTACGTGTVGPPRDGRRTLAIGRYDVAAVLEILSDTIGPTSPPVPGHGEPVVPACVVPLDVTGSTDTVHITVDFDGALTAPCTVTVEAE